MIQFHIEGRDGLCEEPMNAYTGAETSYRFSETRWGDRKKGEAARQSMEQRLESGRVGVSRLLLSRGVPPAEAEEMANEILFFLSGMLTEFGKQENGNR